MHAAIKQKYPSDWIYILILCLFSRNMLDTTRRSKDNADNEYMVLIKFLLSYSNNKLNNKLRDAANEIPILFPKGMVDFCISVLVVRFTNRTCVERRCVSNDRIIRFALRVYTASKETVRY